MSGSANTVGSTTDALVSVVIAARNAESTLADALRSIMEQSYQNLEIIVVDDASTDGTAGIARQLQQGESRIKCISLGQQATLPGALNFGIAQANGEYVARQDADDLSHPSRLELQLQTLASTGADLVSARAVYFRNRFGGNFPVTSGKSISREIKQSELDHANPLVHGSYVFRRAAIAAVGGYDPEYRLAQDYELVSRMIRSGQRVVLLEQALYAYRVQLWNPDIYNRYLFGLRMRGRRAAVDRLRVLRRPLAFAYAVSHFFRKAALVTRSAWFGRALAVAGYALYPPLALSAVRRHRSARASDAVGQP